MNRKKQFTPIAVIWRWMLISILALAPFLWTISARAETATTTDPPVSPDQFKSTMDDALTGHRAELAELRSRLAGLKQLSTVIQDQIRVYDSEMNNQQQTLLMSQIPIEVLEVAIRKNRTASYKLNQQIESLQDQYDRTSPLFIKAGDHIKLLHEQMSSVLSGQVPVEKEQALESTANDLIHVLNEKKEVGKEYLKTYESLLNRLTTARNNAQAHGATLSTRLKSEIDQWFFTPSNTYRRLFSKAFPDSLAAFDKRIKTLIMPATLHQVWEQIKMDDVQQWLLFIFWLSAATWIHVHFRARLERFETEHPESHWHYRCLVVFLLRRSLIYIGMTLVFAVYNKALPFMDITLLRVFFPMFLILLITRWGLDYFRYRSSNAPSPLESFVSSRLMRFFRLLRVILIGLILFIWTAGRDSLLTFLAREMVIVWVFVWTLMFWRGFKPLAKGTDLNRAKAHEPRWRGWLRGWSYLVSGGGILIGVAGYKVLAGYWIASWIKTVTILFWGWITLYAIREWQHDLRDGWDDVDEASAPLGTQPLRWALLQLGLVIWALVLPRGMIWAWDNGGLTTKVNAVFASTFSIGSLSFNLRGIVLAAIILFITRLVVKVSRTYIQDKMRTNTTLEPGLKDSISSIISYCFWGFGLLLALATIGVNATSLAVVFGALSVGIGFGLQTIFNNFISGLILLFERPIQVGDVVDINGLWAEVKKINVRATVVQTFDNASVIIPNSEFVSQQVTNWSFKDRRMRRNLDIGVAYGSDIELVEQTLLAIANASRNVLKFPKPDVLFIEHGDSALIFRLRIWVNVDDYWSVPSQVRFEIDKQFRDKGIEIAFPQRDIHIRNVPETLTQPASAITRRPDGEDEQEISTNTE